MFYFVKGVLVCRKQIENGFLVAVECSSGVAFEIKTTLTSASRFDEIGQEVILYTFFSVRENSIEMFGFHSEEERNFFKMLITVSGVGPNFALSILSTFTVENLLVCLNSGDFNSLTKCRGIGLKTAKRIVLELKDKVKNYATNLDATNVKFKEENECENEAVNALISLGYSKNVAVSAVKEQLLHGTEGASVEEVVKGALRLLVTN